MAIYSEKIAFERMIVDHINNNVFESQLIGLSLNSIELWYNGLPQNNAYERLRDELILVGSKYGFILVESDLSKDIPLDLEEIKMILYKIDEYIPSS